MASSLSSGFFERNLEVEKKDVSRKNFENKIQSKSRETESP
jgi:hypothetical protein